MRIVDSKTVDIYIDGDPDTTENEPFAPAFSRLGINILPEHYLNQSQLTDGITPDISHSSWSTFSTNCFGTGLFYLESFQEGHETILTKWEESWRLNATITSDPALNYLERFGDYSGGLDKLIVRIIPYLEKELFWFEDGSIDIVDFKYYPEPKREYFDYPQYSYQVDLKYKMRFMVMNLRSKRLHIGNQEPAPGDPTITKGLAVRKAIAYAINKEEINEIMHGDLYEELWDPIYSKLGIWCNPDIIKYEFNLNEAKRYMKIAGYDVKDYTPTIGIAFNFELIIILGSLTFTIIYKIKKRPEKYLVN